MKKISITEQRVARHFSYTSENSKLCATLNKFIFNNTLLIFVAFIYALFNELFISNLTFTIRN